MNIEYRHSLQVKYTVDVMVIGGGPAGVAAAVAAARTGASVYLAELWGAFGGAAVNCLVPAFMPFTDGVNFLAGGIGREVYDYIKANAPDSCKPYCPAGIPVETLKLCYDEMISAAGVKFDFFTQISDIITTANSASGLRSADYAVCVTRGETFAVKARVFIDCTGDGDAAALAGAAFLKGDTDGEMMAATLCALWTDINWHSVQRPDSRRLSEAIDNGVFTNADMHLPGMWSISTSVGGSNAGHVYGIDGTSSSSMTEGMIKGRRQLLEYRRYYREYLSGFEKAETVISAPQIGIRETRRITGDYILSAADFEARASFPDEIGRFSYPVDIHSGKNTAEGYRRYADSYRSMRYSKGESYGIPYRALTVSGFDNLLCAGRCISADRAMQSSVRVMPCCYITGQAAGVAAALASSQKAARPDIRAIDISTLRNHLVSLGAYLPEDKLNATEKGKDNL